MTTQPIFSSASAVSALSAVITAMGSGALLKIWSGTVPATCEASDTGTLLVSLPMSSTPFGTPADSGSQSVIATANAITTTNASTGGTAAYFRVTTSGGTCVVQGLCGTSSADLNLASLTIVSGGPVQITSLTMTLPYK